MSGRTIYEAMAEAFVAEGVDTVFGLMGDGNMHWMSAIDQIEGVTTIGVRHEHCSGLMAIGYWSATGNVGVASVTHGPGFTQMMTALTTAVRNNVPMVIFVGEAPLGAAWYLQEMEHAPLARACGAEYVSIKSPKRVYQHIREAFYHAQYQSRPVVLGVPLDLQKMDAAGLGAYVPSATLLPPRAVVTPEEVQMRAVADRLSKASAPVLVAGRGAVHARAAGDIEALADATGALLGTSLLAKGMFDHHPFSLGIVGGYARQAARDAGKHTDLVVAFGASLSRFTLNNGTMFPNAEIIQIDTAPKGLNEGLAVADEYVAADARLAAARLLALCGQSSTAKPSVRTEELARALRDDPADPTHYEIPDGTLDPRDVTDALEKVIPTDYHFVSGSAHQAYWHTTMRGAAPDHYHAIRAFGAIGNAMSFAIGVAVGRGDGRVVVFEGDGGMLMHIQELETLKRHGIKLLMVIYDDGAFGAEIHKLRVDDVDDSGAVFGRPDFEAIAKAFGLGGATATRLDQFAALMEEYEAGETAAIWDVHVSDQVLTPPMRDEVAGLRGK